MLGPAKLDTLFSIEPPPKKLKIEREPDDLEMVPLEPKLPQEIWQKFFSYFSVVELFCLKAVSRSWYVVIFEIQNTILEQSANKTYLYCHDVFWRWAKRGNEQNKPVNWEHVLQKECDFELDLLSDQPLACEKRTLDLEIYTEKGRENCLAMGHYLMAWGSIERSHESRELEGVFVGPKENLGFKINGGISSIQKLSEDKFAVIEDFDTTNKVTPIKIYSFDGDGIKTVIASQMPLKYPKIYASQENYVITGFSVRSVQLKEGNDLIFHSHAAIFSLDGLVQQKFSYQFAPGESDGTLECVALTENYLIVSDLNQKKLIVIFDRKIKRSIKFPYQFLNSLENIILFWNAEKKEILVFNFEKADEAPIPLLDLSFEGQELFSHLTPTLFLFVDERKIYFYSREQRKVILTQELLEEPTDKIFKCQFVKVTQSYIILLITIEDTDGDLQEVIHFYSISSNQLNLIQTSKNHYVFFNDNYLITLNRTESLDLDYPHEIVFQKIVP